MNELVILNGIKKQFSGALPDYGINDFPVILADYMPKHPKGELLLKSAGFRIVRYLDRNNQMDMLRIGNFIVMEYQWRVDLIVKDIRSLLPIYDLSQKAIDAMKNVQLQPIEELEEWGQFYLMDASEPDFDYEKKYQFRTLLFGLQVLQLITQTG